MAPEEEAKEVAGEVAETPTPEESKSVLELIAEKDAAEAAEKAPEVTETAVEETETPTVETEVAEETKEVVEETPPEPRQVPVSALQKERQRRQAAERRAKEQDERIAALEAQKPAEPKPQLENFESEAQFDTAVRAREIDEAVDRKLQVHDEAEAQRSARLRAEKEAGDFTSRMDKAALKYEDWDESFEYVSSVSGEHAGYSRALVTSEVAGEVIDHLAKNPAEAERIATLSPEGQVKAIGRIEDKIISPPKPNTTTRAPKPIAPVGGIAKTANIKWKANMSKAERAVWKKQAAESGASIAELME